MFWSKKKDIKDKELLAFIKEMHEVIAEIDVYEKRISKKVSELDSFCIDLQKRIQTNAENVEYMSTNMALLTANITKIYERISTLESLLALRGTTSSGGTHKLS